MTTRYTNIRCMVGGSPALRTAQLEGQDYTVYPGIAIVGNVVVHPMNSTGPEFVPAQELSYTPQAWNDRPIIPDHPVDDNGVPVSALTPTILEGQSFGKLFNTVFEDNKLKPELWVNEAKALELGGEPQRVVECLQKGEVVEVSIGAYIDVEPVKGNYNGQDYVGVWHNIVPDHLAVGLNGAKGACSVEMGAGAPRVNKKGVGDMTRGMLRAAEEGGPDMSKSMWRRLSHFTRSLATNNDVERALDDLLWNQVNNYDWWIDVDQPNTIVYFRTYPDSKLWGYNYTADSDGMPLELEGDMFEVQKKTEYVPITATSSGGPTPVPLGGGTMSLSPEVEALVTKIVGLESSPWTDDNKAGIESLEAVQLEKMLALYEAPVEPTSEPSDVTPTPDLPANMRAIPEDEYLELKGAAETVAADKAKKKSALIETIKAASSNKLTDVQLEAMDIEVLTSLAPEPQEPNPLNPTGGDFGGFAVGGLRFVPDPTSSSKGKAPNGLTAATNSSNN